MSMTPSVKDELLGVCINNIYQSMQTLINEGVIQEDGNVNHFAKVLLAKLYLIKAGIKD